VPFDIVNTQDSERAQVDPGIEIRNRAAFHQGAKLIEAGRTGTSRLDEGGHALVDPDAVRESEAQAAVSMDMDVYPSRTDHQPGNINDFGFPLSDRPGADAQHLAVPEDNIGDLIDTLRRVNNTTPLEHRLYTH